MTMLPLILNQCTEFSDPSGAISRWSFFHQFFFLPLFFSVSFSFFLFFILFFFSPFLSPSFSLVGLHIRAIEVQ
jgi:hypothetical protein